MKQKTSEKTFSAIVTDTGTVQMDYELIPVFQAKALLRITEFVNQARRFRCEGDPFETAVLKTTEFYRLASEIIDHAAKVCKMSNDICVGKKQDQESQAKGSEA